jgi:hypothetical protein
MAAIEKKWGLWGTSAGLVLGMGGLEMVRMVGTVGRGGCMAGG